MGVTYKLTQEVVDFIIKERQSHPLASCRQLAESASAQFGLHLSKSSVHDVLKESGIATPRGRKPKDRFEIPVEKKQQIHTSLSIAIKPAAPELLLQPLQQVSQEAQTPVIKPTEISAQYAKAGEIFLKAALWDLGIFSEEPVKNTDQMYYLSYAKGVDVRLEDGRNFFLELPLPIERCIKEVADGLVNNVRPFVAAGVSDQGLFEACMAAKPKCKMANISIVDHKYHNIAIFSDIMEYKRNFILGNRFFMECGILEPRNRSKSLFFAQMINTEDVMDNILNLSGFDVLTSQEKVVKLLVPSEFSGRDVLQKAAEKLDLSYIYDVDGRHIKVALS